MEGISHEAASFAGTQKLGKLIAIYDDNGISIDGKVQGWFADDTAMRFEAYGWHVMPHVDGQDSEAVAEALAAARAVTDDPSLICAKTVIGWGAPNKQGTAAMHGEADGQRGNRRDPRGARLDLAAVRDSRRDPRGLGHARQGRAGRAAVAREISRPTRPNSPALAAELERRMAGDLPAGFDDS